MREVVLFLMNQRAEDLMMGAPSEISGFRDFSGADNVAQSPVGGLILRVAVGAVAPSVRRAGRGQPSEQTEGYFGSIGLLFRINRASRNIAKSPILPAKTALRRPSESLPCEGQSDDWLTSGFFYQIFTKNIHQGGMARACTTCQHLKRPEIACRLAAGEPTGQVARDYGINPSSLHRHRVNCLKLGSANAIKKEAARGTAAIALLPSRETLSSAYLELRNRIDQIVTQAQAEGSLAVAVSGLNSLRQTLDSLARLAGHIGSAAAQVNVAIQNNVNVDVRQIAERLIIQFDKEPELKARIAQALLRPDDNANVQVTADQTNSNQLTHNGGVS